MLYCEINVIEVISANQWFLNVPEKEIATRKGTIVLQEQLRKEQKINNRGEALTQEHTI